MSDYTGIDYERIASIVRAELVAREQIVLKELITRAADAIEEHCVDGFWECADLVRELREASK
jgi:hypothetical protein